MIENFLSNLNFWQWQILIVISILFVRNSLYVLFNLGKNEHGEISSIIFMILFNGFILGLIYWTWTHTYSWVFVLQMLVIVFTYSANPEFIHSIPRVFYILSLPILILFIGYDYWKTWDEKTYQCRPPTCTPKEKVICVKERWDIADGFEEKEICKTNNTNKLFSFSHCKVESGAFNNGMEWESVVCFDEHGKVVYEDFDD